MFRLNFSVTHSFAQLVSWSCQAMTAILGYSCQVPLIPPFDTSLTRVEMAIANNS